MMFPMANGVAQFTTGANDGSDIFLDSLRVENSAAPKARIVFAGGVASANGVLFDSTGRLVCFDASVGLPAGYQYSNGLPVASDGALCISTNLPVSYTNGIALDVNGAVSAAWA